jgi:hypothetical protein
MSADLPAIVHDAENWRANRDAMVRVAMQALAQSGAGLDFLGVQFALAAAFNEAAQQEMTRQGASVAWAVLKRNAERLSAP